MAIVITGDNVLIEGDKYDALCNRAEQALRLEKVVIVVGEVLFYNWEDNDEDAAAAINRLREAYEKL